MGGWVAWAPHWRVVGVVVGEEHCWERRGVGLERVFYGVAVGGVVGQESQAEAEVGAVFRVEDLRGRPERAVAVSTYPGA